MPGRRLCAIKNYDHAIGGDPESVLFYTKMGETHFALGFAPDHYNRGRLLHDLGYYEFPEIGFTYVETSE